MNCFQPIRLEDSFSKLNITENISNYNPTITDHTDVEKMSPIRGLNYVAPFYSGFLGIAPISEIKLSSERLTELTKIFGKEVEFINKNHSINTVATAITSVTAIFNSNNILDQILNKEFEQNEIFINSTTKWNFIPEHDWYTNYDDIHYYISNQEQRYVLPNLISRKYISIENRYKRIKIDKFQKGRNITVEDILFASRGLFLDGSRNSEKFNVVEKTSNILELELHLDNETINRDILRL